MEQDAKFEILSSVPKGPEEERVIKENRWCQIRAMYEQGQSKAAIAREMGVDPKTVWKWVKEKWKPQKRERKSALEAHEIFLRARAPEVGYNVAVLYRELEPRGYQGSYPALVKYIRPWRVEAREEMLATQRYETEPGEHYGKCCAMLRRLLVIRSFPYCCRDCSDSCFP